MLSNCRNCRGMARMSGRYGHGSDGEWARRTARHKFGEVFAPIKELSDRSTQILIFLSFVLAASGALGSYNSPVPTQARALALAMHWWVRSVYLASNSRDRASQGRYARTIQPGMRSSAGSSSHSSGLHVFLYSSVHVNSPRPYRARIGERTVLRPMRSNVWASVWRAPRCPRAAPKGNVYSMGNWSGR